MQISGPVNPDSLHQRLPLATDVDETKLAGIFVFKNLKFPAFRWAVKRNLHVPAGIVFHCV